MAKTDRKRKNKRVKKLIAICVICAVVLMVSTYAWFIGMKTVTVNSFDIDIATTEGLYLSMDGNTWTTTLDAKEAVAYAKNANVWADSDDTGLIPMSTVGDMDKTSSRLKLFEKGSLTTTKGGYRLLTSRVANNTNLDPDKGQYTEGKGYVAFDLFIKNLSGTEYYEDNEPLNEEAIYLTYNSAVKVASEGGVADSGIENSIRVAFAQIGRVVATTETADDITGITCTDAGDGESHAKVTGICRNAQIWEPNDTAHVQNALNWFQKSCKTRKAEGATVSDPESYNDAACATLSTSQAYPTYAISRALDVSDNVDIYDGTEFNTYTANTTDYATYAAGESESKTYKLVNFPYFTDTMKNVKGADRNTFMTLAPNSITKVRVYIYIEGQDIDNYDFAQLGKKVSINFGFTKERYTEEDYEEYDGPTTGTDAEHTS